MKVPVVFASVFLCCMVGELFGDIIPETEYVILENSDLEPDRRAVVNDPFGCVKEPDNKGSIIYRRPQYTRLRGQFRVLKSQINIPLMRYPPTLGYKNPKYVQNQKAPIRVVGKVPPSGLKPLPGNINEGKYLEGLPQIGRAKTNFGAIFMSLYRHKQGRQILRRMLDTEEVEPNSEGDAEETLEY